MSQSIYADFGVSNAVISGEISEHEEKMISQPVDVRDGDDAITFNIQEEPQIEVTQHDDFTPEIDRIDINTETGEIEGGEELTEESGDEMSFDAVGEASTHMETIGKEVAEASSQQQAIVAEALEKGLDPAVMEVIENEYQTDGKLSDSSYQALEALGYSKAFVDTFMRGQEALTQRFVKSIYDYAGGEAQFAKISECIANDASLTDAFNSAIDRNDVATMKVLMDSAKNTLRQSFGVKPQRDITKAAKPATVSPSVNQVEPFGSRDEMVKAMSDPRYMRDASYRSEVERRVAVSF